MRTPSKTPFLLFLLSTFLSPTIAGDTLTPSQRLTVGQTLVSAGGSFALGFFSPANSDNRYVGIWYNKISVRTVVWVANRQTPTTNPSASLSITPNGTLVITNNNSTDIVWSSSTTMLAKPVAQILDAGNFVVREANSNILGNIDSFAWQSFDYPTDTLLPGMMLGWNLASGFNRNLTSWKTSTDPSPGPFTIALDAQGDPQIFLLSGSNPVWRSGPWDGAHFSGIAEMPNFSALNLPFFTTSQEMHYNFYILYDYIVSRLMVKYDGTMQWLVWVNKTGMWSVFWSVPEDRCDALSTCGPYGVCNPNNSLICSCLQGFVPKSPTNRLRRDGRDGCVRRTALDCRNGTDGFVKVQQVKLPDTSRSTVNLSMGLDECRATCLQNCSCTAYASAGITGSGCIIWTTELTDIKVNKFEGDDLYVRLAAADLGFAGSTPNRCHLTGLGVAAIVLGVVLGMLLPVWTVCNLWIKMKIRMRRDETAGGNDLEVPLFDLSTIVAATDDFNIKNKLGEGGFGPVYKGKLGEQKEIAVKRLAKSSVQGIDELKNEIELMAKLQHRNLIRLLGCCMEGDERMLVYEYMPNKSLDAFLFGKIKGITLDWRTRYRIITGIARGLLYLHQESRFKIIHRDLKASNILLDEDMNPKISDFGMAKIFEGGETQVNTKKVVGTYGYMSPEYAMDGMFSVKSDVYSFGVLILEIISGIKNRGSCFSEPRLNLVGHAWNLWNEGKELELVDETMDHSFPAVEALRCIKVGLLCVKERPEDRPIMSSVVILLASDDASLPQPKRPGCAASRSLFEIESSSSIPESFGISNMTIGEKEKIIRSW